MYLEYFVTAVLIMTPLFLAGAMFYKLMVWGYMKWRGAV